MAFVKKTATKTPAQYARTKQAEAQGVEEEIEDGIEEGEEVMDDYAGEDEPEPAPAPAPTRPAFRRPASAPVQTQAPAPVKSPAQPQSGEDQAIRLTGFFPSKREGCLVGRMRESEIAKLVPLLDSAQHSNKEVVLFLWENQPEEGRPLFSLTANLTAPAQKKPWGGNRGGNFGGQNRGFRRY